jgi:hypothetical protein
VDQEAADELIGGNRHQALLITASIIPPTERDIAAIEGHQSVIGDGDAVRIATQVTKNLFRLRMEHPIKIRKPFEFAPLQ